MEEKKGSRTGRLARSIFNPRVWMSYDQVKDSTSYLVTGVKKLFVAPLTQPKSSDDFKQACRELNLDGEQLASRKKYLFRLALLSFILAVIVFAYVVFQLAEGNYHTVVASLVIVAVLLSMAFRYHFWWFQIKQKRLGCTLREWFVRGLLRGGR